MPQLGYPVFPGGTDKERTFVSFHEVTENGLENIRVLPAESICHER